MRHKNVGATFFHFVTNQAFDRQTNRQTDTFLEASPRWHSMQRGNEIKSQKIISNYICLETRRE